MEAPVSVRPVESPFPPLQNRKAWIEVWRPQPGQSLEGICLNQELVAAFTHWNDALNAKVQCIQPCEFAKCEETRRWYGYMPVLCERRGRIICLEVTCQAARDCNALSTLKIPLRGKTLKVGRHKSRGKCGRCWAAVTDYSLGKPIPPAQDPQDLLDRVFRFLAGCRPMVEKCPVPDANGREGGDA